LASRSRTKIARPFHRPAFCYAKGGAAVVDDSDAVRSAASGVALASTADTSWGGVIGAGFECGFTPNRSVAAEYDHTLMGTSTINFATRGAFFGFDRIKQDVNLFTARLNDKFGGRPWRGTDFKALCFGSKELWPWPGLKFFADLRPISGTNSAMSFPAAAR
jgi:hypothetical protein